MDSREKAQKAQKKEEVGRVGLRQDWKLDTGEGERHFRAPILRSYSEALP
jgi:hypothetical protein